MSSRREAGQINSKDAKDLGVWTEHAQMPNGERRFRLKNTDGTAYIRTEATDNSGWQKSHYHKSVQETYIVQNGQMVLAEWIDEKLRIRIFGPNEIVTTQPNIPHNVYLFGKAIIHTVKHGDESEISDCHVFPALDEETLHLKEADIVRLASKNT